jgi:hypothetical protein
MLEVLLDCHDIVHYEFIPEGKTVNKEMILTSLVALRLLSEGNVPTVENRQLISPSRQCSSTPVGFGQGFRSKEQCDNTGASSSSLMTWFQLSFTCSLD